MLYWTSLDPGNDMFKQYHTEPQAVLIFSTAARLECDIAFMQHLNNRLLIVIGIL